MTCSFTHAIRKFFLFLISVSLLGACKKESNTPSGPLTKTDLLIGKWTAKASGTDLNNNDSLEVSEYESMPAGLIVYQTFTADKRAFIDVTSYGKTVLTDNFMWELTDNDQKLLRISDGDTLVHFIKSFTPNQITGLIKFSSGTEYFIWGK